MSNQLVGVVFDRVIQEVCDASQIDFEEGGVDQQTLEDLRKGWQKKLTSLGVAQFPWDPAPQPPPPPPQQAPIPPPPVTVPSNAPRPSPPSPQQEFTEHAPQVQHAPQSGMGSGQAAGEVRIKTEPGYSPSPTGFPSATPAQIAQQRAANALHQRYGAAAANQINQLQAQSQSQAALSLPGQQRFPPGQFPNSQNSDPKLSHQQTHSIGNGQTDGAGDSGDDALAEWKAEVARRREAAKENGAKADRMMRKYVELRGREMEGNGLLAPLREQYPGANGKKRRVAIKQDAAFSGLAATVSETNTTPHVGGYDGIDEFSIKKDEDEDAINSDLDDPDDLADDHEGDDALGQVMLCTYDKVQRVKSKWKCTLKDGVLTTGGKEYVFHKGTGDFEWY